MTTGTYLTARHAADVIGVNRVTVSAWIKRGTLTAWRDGNRYYIRADDAERIAATYTRHPWGTRCKSGRHDWTIPGALYVAPSGQHHCRICAKLRRKPWRAT